MNLAKKIRILILSISIFLMNIQNLIALENKILFKIEDEIITTIDIYEEIKFLKTFNPEINNLSEKNYLKYLKILF